MRASALYFSIWLLHYTLDAGIGSCKLIKIDIMLSDIKPRLYLAPKGPVLCIFTTMRRFILKGRGNVHVNSVPVLFQDSTE